MDRVYTNPLPSRTLAQYATFLAEHLDNEYARNLVYNAFLAFFRRNIAAYDYQGQSLNFVGSTCVLFKDILVQAAADFGVGVSKTIRYSMPGLVEYHAAD